ncbi:minor capsid protein [Baileyella intestinalis]|uniref:minor capsid protein n=1 Tax=Baileyella intestinalis TaxID=2606709 RepID=UPI003A8C2CF6
MRPTSRQKEYWYLRELKAKKEYDKSEAETLQELTKIYQDMEASVQKEINAFYGRYAKKEGITMAEARRRADRLDIEEYGRKAEVYVKNRDLSPQANKEMRLYNLTMKANRLEVLKAKIQLELVRCYEEMGQTMNQALSDRAYDEMERQAGILGQTVPDPQTAAESIVNASFKGATFSSRIWQSQALLRDELNVQLQIGLIQGKNSRVLARAIRDRFGVSKRNAERLMRTELCRVQIEAQMRSYEAMKFDEYMFIALETACDICNTLNGETFKVADALSGENAPPMHPNCRCSTAAYVSEPIFK